MPIYNKLVRDRILEIIENSGKTYTYSVLDEVDYIKELRKKLLEEMQEYLKAIDSKNCIEELADLLEVIFSLAKIHGVTEEDLLNIRISKAVARGGFEKRIYLNEVHELDNRK